MHFAGKTDLFIYTTCSCSLSDNSKVIDLVQVYKVSKMFPKHSNGDHVWCFVERVLFPRQAIHTKDALYSTSGWGKEANILLVIGQ